MIVLIIDSFQEELDDIIRYGSKELFVDETEEAKARQIHYDDAAIERLAYVVNIWIFALFISLVGSTKCGFYRLLDRERAGDEETNLDEVDDNEFLKAFKVCIYLIQFLTQCRLIISLLLDTACQLANSKKTLFCSYFSYVQFGDLVCFALFYVWIAWRVTSFLFALYDLIFCC